jgi:signal transduction histidine kinase
MRSARTRDRAALAPAIKVAVWAAVVVGCLYVAVVALLVALVTHRLTTETDHRLALQLAAVKQHASTQPLATENFGDADDAPVYAWFVAADGAVTSTSADAPPLPASFASRTSGFPRSARIGGADFRVDEATMAHGDRLFVAESLAQERHVRYLLLLTALIVSPVLIGGVFAGALIVGRRASKPIEQARRQQLEFTADASHELRTPLTVIDAEVNLALSADRTAYAYRESLERVASESNRLRRIVEDLLWLARFDSQPPPPREELVDLPTLVSRCAQRFVPVAAARSVDLRLEVPAAPDSLIAGPPEWVDRLIGVLIDNAIRYAGSNAHVEVAVSTSSAHVILAVSDDGPGIPEEQRARLFDRFHRADNSAGESGAGLGLAIADAIVRSTDGRWSVGESAIGGTLMSVTWPRALTGRRSARSDNSPTPDDFPDRRRSQQLSTD